MKRIFSILLLIAIASSANAQQLKSLIKKAKETVAGNSGQLGVQDIAAGLKRPLPSVQKKEQQRSLKKMDSWATPC